MAFLPLHYHIFEMAKGIRRTVCERNFIIVVFKLVLKGQIIKTLKVAYFHNLIIDNLLVFLLFKD